MATATQIPTITRDDLKSRLARGDKPMLVEVLPRHTFLQGHLPGAINLPPDEIKQLAPHRLPDKNAEIIIYSQSDLDTHSLCEPAAHELMAMGYKNVRVYREGKTDWVDSGNTLESGEEPFNKAEVGDPSRAFSQRP